MVCKRAFTVIFWAHCEVLIVIVVYCKKWRLGAKESTI